MAGRGRGVIFLLFTAVNCHNWINHPSRATKVATTKPCPPKAKLQQTHLQANPGQTFQVEWATGHPSSRGSFVLVEAKDEAKLLQYDDAVSEAYIAGAPSSRTYYPMYQVARNVDVEKNYMRAKMSRTEADCYAKDDPLFAGVVDRNHAHARPRRFRDLSNNGQEPGFFEYSSNISLDCRSTHWVSYDSKAYPWIKAVLSYKVLEHYPDDGAISLFKVPEALASGKYVLLWLWRGYRDCSDINVVAPDKKVTDIWGTSTGGTQYVRIDHCKSWPKVWDPTPVGQEEIANQKASVPGLEAERAAAIEEESDVLEAFNAEVAAGTMKSWEKWSYTPWKTAHEAANNAKKAYADAINKGVWSTGLSCFKIPANSTDAGPCIEYMSGRGVPMINIIDPYIGNKGALYGTYSGQMYDEFVPSRCLVGDYDVGLEEGDKLCYGLREGQPNDGGPARDMAPDDPDDPAFYSTCYERVSGGDLTFSGNTCGDDCLVEATAVTPVWRFGDRCTSCDTATLNTNTSSTFLPSWQLAAVCKSCDKGCGNWCAQHSQPWEQKCRWSSGVCSACPECG